MGQHCGAGQKEGWRAQVLYQLVQTQQQNCKGWVLSTLDRGYPGLFTWCSVVFHTGPEIWLLASGVRGGS